MVAMLSIFITIGDVFIDSGFGTALIQKQNITELDTSSVFFFNLFLGFIFASLLFFSAPVIAEFYNQPVLTCLARALSLTFIINAFGMMQANLLVKTVDFRSIAKLSLISQCTSGLIGIAMAFKGYGVWSLITQQILGSFIRNISYWFYSPWRPSLSFSTVALRQLMRFSLSILAIGILNRTSESLYYMVIGKLFSATELGIFSRANSLSSMPPTSLATAVGRVTFPVYSKLQQDPVLLKSALKKTLTVVCFLIFPIMLGMAIVAEPLILFLLTEKWIATVPYLQLLSVVGMIFPLEWIRQQALQAVGRPDLSLKVEIIKKITLFISISVMWYFGIFGIIAGMIAVSFLSLFLNIRYTSLLTQYKTSEQLLDMMPYLLISIAMCFIVSITNHFLNDSRPFYRLLVNTLTGVLFYMGMAWTFRTPAIRTIARELNLLRLERS